MQQVQRADAEADSLTAKLDRRTRLFDEERKLYYKEFLMLKEMVRRAGLLEADNALLQSFEGVYAQARSHAARVRRDSPACSSHAPSPPLRVLGHPCVGDHTHTHPTPCSASIPHAVMDVMSWM